MVGTDHEYGALDKTWTFLCGRCGARYVRAELPCPIESADQVVEAVWARVTDRTKVLFLSHITSPTALTLPVGPLVRRARDAGILTVVDGAHAPGQIPVDLHALGVDFYGGNCHKWMCAPKGAGFLYARREVQPLLEPLVVSWGWPGSFVDVQQRQATRDIAAYLAVPAAIEFQQAHDWPAVQRACHALAQHARSILADIGGLPPLFSGLARMVRADGGRAGSPRRRRRGAEAPVDRAAASRCRSRRGTGGRSSACRSRRTTPRRTSTRSRPRFGAWCGRRPSGSRFSAPRCSRPTRRVSATAAAAGGPPTAGRPRSTRRR